MKINNIFTLLFVFLSFSIVQAQNKGPVTPTTVTYTFNSAQLTTFDDENWGLFQTPINHTFSKSDADFANAEIADITIAYGRYKSVSLCMASLVSMTIDGETYKGQSGTSFSQGNTIYGQVDGTVDNTDPGSVQTVTVGTTSGDQSCTTTYFRVPLCVTSSETTGCEDGDEIYTSEGKIDPATGQVDLESGAAVSLQLSFLMDMLNSVIVNADDGEVTTAPAVRVTLGKPGAALHLGNWDAGGATDVSLIFSNDKTLLSVMSTEYPGSHSPGFCDGQSSAAVTAVPAGSPLPTGVIFITHSDDSTGKVAYPSTSACPDASNCTPSGFNVFANVLQEVAQTTTVNCLASSDGSVPQYLKDFTYVGTPGSGEAGGPVTMAIQRIVDPTNLFGICTSSSVGYMTGKTGVCTYAGADADGY
ncbi:MAG: hypothetical protein AB7O96_08910 [Pseudobdellovibrionaceae bacterium]